MAQAEAPLSKLPWMANRPTDEEDLHLKALSKTVIVSVFACKLKALANSRGSYPLARPMTTLAIRYTASSSDKTCCNLDSITSTCTYYNTVNKRIHIISAYFLAASDKHMRLLGLGRLCSIFYPLCYSNMLKILPIML